MQSFKRYLTEKSAVIDEITLGTAKSFTNSLYKRLGGYMKQEPEQNGDWWDLMIRADQYFTSRPGEEDDDWPDYTGHKEVEKIVKRLIPDTFQYEITPEEKSWITISIKPRKQPTRAASKIKSKKYSDLMKAAIKEADALPPGSARVFTLNLIKELRKVVKPKLTKIEFSEIAMKIPFASINSVEILWNLA